MANPLDQITAFLGLAAGTAAAYCNGIRAATAGPPPKNADIAQALRELGRDAATDQIAKRADEIARARRLAEPGARLRGAQLPRRFDVRPHIVSRCSCGRPAIPGEGACYTCSS